MKTKNPKANPQAQMPVRCSALLTTINTDRNYLERLRAIKVPIGLATIPSSYHVPEYVSPSSVPSKPYTPSAKPHPTRYTENRKLPQVPPQPSPPEQRNRQVLVPFGTAPKTQVPEVSV